MSLKVFHVVFIAVCLSFWAGFGVWAIRHARSSHDRADLFLGLGAFAIGIVLTAYLLWFLRKINKIHAS